MQSYINLDWIERITKGFMVHGFRRIKDGKKGKERKKETAVQQMIEFPPDDNSGSSSSNRFAYQMNWALFKMLELE